MVRVVKNTYKRYPKVAYAEVADICKWVMGISRYDLVRLSDDKIVFSTAPIDRNGALRSNGKRPVLFGCIAKYKDQEFVVERI